MFFTLSQVALMQPRVDVADSLEPEVDSLQQQLDQKDARLAELASEVEGLRRRVEELNADLAARDAEKASLLGDLEQTIQEAEKAAADVAQERIDQLQRQLDGLSQSSTDNSTASDALVQELRAQLAAKDSEETQLIKKISDHAAQVWGKGGSFLIFRRLCAVIVHRSLHLRVFLHFHVDRASLRVTRSLRINLSTCACF